MKKRALFLPVLLALLLVLTACDTAPKEPQMLYEEAPSKHNYGVYHTGNRCSTTVFYVCRRSCNRASCRNSTK